MAEDKKPTVKQIIDEVIADVCNRLCKYPEEYANKGYGYDKLLEKIYSNCPLNRL